MDIVLAILQPVVLLLLAPFISGTSRVLRAKMHTRKGPSIFQDYYDIIKLFKRQDVHTTDSGLLFKLTPALYLTAMVLLAMGIPMASRYCPVPFLGDFIVIIYLLVVPRLLLSLASVESTGSYPSVGGIRELLLGVLTEPAILLSMLVALLATGATHIDEMGIAVLNGDITSPIAFALAGVAFAIVCYMELGKLPFDVAEAEQELQEGPLAEYSGPSFALLKLGMTMRQVVLIGWFLAVFVPFGMPAEMAFPDFILGFIIFFVKIAIVFIICAVIENTVSRVRFKLLSRQTWLVFGLSVLAFAFLLTGV